MDYNHLISVDDETNFDELNFDLPFAIFMMKLLSYKIDFRKMSTKSYKEYIKSDNPIKLRYFIQTKLKAEIQKCFQEAITENNNEINELGNLYTHTTTHGPQNYFINEDKEVLYDKYLKDNISETEKEDFFIQNPASDRKMYETILMIINKKKKDIMRIPVIELINQLNKIRTQQSIYTLLNSINDVNRVGLLGIK